MGFRYPYSYSFGILRPNNSARQPPDLDPGVYLNRLYINPRLRPIILNVDDNVGSTVPRSTNRGLRFQDPAPEMYSPVSRMDLRGRQNRPLRGSALVPHELGVVDEHGSQSARTGTMTRRDDVLPFSLAIKELYHQLEAGAEFYASFDSEYEKDIVRIKTYATKEILENLWTRKVRRARNPRSALQDQDRDRYIDNDFAEYEDQFAVWKRKLCHALDGAIASRLDEGRQDERNSTRHQSMVRMIDKIRTANRQLLPLLDSAWKRQVLCKDLVTELDLLKDLVTSGGRGSKRLSNTASNSSAANGETVEGEDWKPGPDQSGSNW